MNVKHVLMIAAVLLAFFVCPVMGDNVAVSEDFPAKYTLVVPPGGVTLNDAEAEAEVSVTPTFLGTEKYAEILVYVDSANNWHLRLGETSDYDLKYGVTVIGGTEQLENGDKVLSADKENEKTEVTLKFKRTDEPTKAGTYTDVLTFTAAPVNANTQTVTSAEELTALWNGEGTDVSILLTKDVTIDENERLPIPSGKEVTLNLNGHTLSSINSETETHNFFIDVKGGTLTVQDGTISYEHTGDNMAWNGAATVIDVTAGGVLNMEGVTVKNNGGTDMNFAVHLNNWGEVTLNADNCVFDAPYCGVRVFNSGPDMNNVKITNSELTGNTRAFWVHNYFSSDMGGKLYSGASVDYDESKVLNRLNLDIYDNNNEFSITGTARSPIRYGFNDDVFFDASGNVVTP